MYQVSEPRMPHQRGSKHKWHALTQHFPQMLSFESIVTAFSLLILNFFMIFSKGFTV